MAWVVFPDAAAANGRAMRHGTGWGGVAGVYGRRKGSFWKGEAGGRAPHPRREVFDTSHMGPEGVLVVEGGVGVFFF